MQTSHSSFSSFNESIPEKPADERPKIQPRKVDSRVKRNDPCPCGSGKKYKSCCGKHLNEQ